MKISRTVSYAVQAVLQLGQIPTQEPVPCSRIAAEGHMPERFLLQILRNLVTHGILRSTRGVDGGYTLDRSAEDISLLEVIEAIDGPMVPSVLVGNGLPNESQKSLQEALTKVTAMVREQLGAIKVSHLMAPTATESVAQI